MGLISRVSSRTYRLYMLHVRLKKSKILSYQNAIVTVIIIVLYFIKFSHNSKNEKSDLSDFPEITAIPPITQDLSKFHSNLSILPQTHQNHTFSSKTCPH